MPRYTIDRAFIASIVHSAIKEKGGLAAPLFFLSLVFAAAGSMLGTVTPWALSAMAMALVGPGGSSVTFPSPWIKVAVLGYCLLVALNVLLISPAYTPAGLFHPLLLALGYFGFRNLTDLTARRAAFAGLTFGVILAVWGLVQIGLSGIARAHAMFETPATYAAVINLLLLPVLAGVLVAPRGFLLPAVGGVLAASLFAADSRGGLLALVAGTGAALILGLRAGMLQRRGLGLVMVLLASAWLTVVAVRSLPAMDSEASTPDSRAEASMSRIELYALSLNAWREHPLAGTGYLTFRYALEKERAHAPSYGIASETWFVHNDYIQTLQELGPMGLLAILGITVVPPLLAYRKLSSLADAQRPIVVAAAAGLVAMAVHALVDFPFFIPVCLLMYGALLGALDVRLGGAGIQPGNDWISTRWSRAARTGAITIAVLILLRPVAAEAAAEWGLHKLAAGEGQRAAFWLGAAQRLDPRDWRYHWYAGQFWDAQAAVSGKPEAARLAAEAYAAGFSANPLEVKNLLGKISVHRRHRQLLREPADPSTLRQWLAQAKALAPLNAEVQRELAR